MNNVFVQILNLFLDNIFLTLPHKVPATVSAALYFIDSSLQVLVKVSSRPTKDRKRNFGKIV